MDTTITDLGVIDGGSVGDTTLTGTRTILHTTGILVFMPTPFFTILFIALLTIETTDITEIIDITTIITETVTTDLQEVQILIEEVIA